MSAPILMGDRLLGVINVANKNTFESNVFTDLDLKILRMISRHVAVAMENATLYKKLNYLTVTDPLTHMYNYRYFSTYLDHEIKRMKRYSENLCLLMIDVDNFKLYNDTFGLLEGDLLLKKMSTVLSKCLREVDIACRYAGDEFVVILPRVSLANAAIVADKIKRNFENSEFKTPMTLSIGIAECVEKMNRHALILKADTALYQAKKKGKNKVAVI